MLALLPYLNFNGNARDAMTFYHKALGGDLRVTTFADMHMDAPPGGENMVINAQLTNNHIKLMASDSRPEMPTQFGNNQHAMLECESEAEIDRLYSALSDGARTITMALHTAFWGAKFGMFVDRFGTSWMLNYDFPKEG